MTTTTRARRQGRYQTDRSREVKTGLISGRTFTNQPVRYVVIDGLAVFEGDIVLGTAAELEAAAANGEATDPGLLGIAHPDEKLRWPGGLVPYEIDAMLSEPKRVRDAIAHWRQRTHIRFVRRTAANAAVHPDYLVFEKRNETYSSVGRVGGSQVIGVDPTCTAGNLIHEIGHAMGLWHEQGRQDRDSFVTIHFENIDEKNHHNFDQHIVDGDDVGPYDYDSIMHYEPTAFALDKTKDSISPKNPADRPRLGQRKQLSAGDVAAIRELYPPVHV